MRERTKPSKPETAVAIQAVESIYAESRFPVVGNGPIDEFSSKWLEIMREERGSDCDMTTKLLPSEQTEAQQHALSLLLQRGSIRVFYPDEPNSSIYMEYSMDGGKFWRNQRSGWEEVAASQAIDDVARLAAEGYPCYP